MKAIDLTGKRFLRLTVIRQAPSNIQPAGRPRRMWECECDCGQIAIVAGGHLTTGHTESCGCLAHELHQQRAGLIATYGNTTHGLSHTPEYTSWKAMEHRCQNPLASHFGLYGGRGIKVCERWSKFEHFLEDMGKRPTPQHSLDRINPDGHYEPGNCRWASKKEQSYNRRDNAVFTAHGVTKHVREWAKDLGLGINAIPARIKNGWDPVMAVTVGKTYRMKACQRARVLLDQHG